MTHKIAAITDSGIIPNNQDNFFCNGMYKHNLSEQKLELEMTTCSKDHNVYAVFDGVGGLYEGGLAALTACKAIYDTCWIKKADVGTGILQADNYVIEDSLQSGHKMGSTCVILEEREGHFRSWNVGDSRAYYYYDNELIQMSKDHTEAENARLIQKKTGESFIIPSRYEHNLTQYLGADKTVYAVEPFVSEWFKKNEGCKVLLCSDGLYNYVDRGTIIEVLRKDVSTINKCRELVSAVFLNRGKDNITVVLIEYEH